MRNKEVKIMLGLALVMLLGACGNSTEQILRADSQGTTETESREADNTSMSVEEQSKTESDDTEQEKGQRREPDPLILDSLTENEAIVVDDSAEDLWKNADGSEVDYPALAKDDELVLYFQSGKQQ